MSEKEKNIETIKSKKDLKIAFIISLIIVVIAGASVGGYFGYKHYSENKSTGAEWADSYYNYIVNDEPNTEEYYKINSLQDAEIGFIQTEEYNKPLMITTGKKDENNFKFNCAMIYEIDENNNVAKPTIFETTENIDVEFLFDVQKKKYDYFINTSSEWSSTYTSIDTAIKDKKKYTEIQEKLANKKSEITADDSTAITKEYEEYKKNDLTRTEYTISKKEQTVTQNTLSGETISYNKQDEYIIDPEIEEKTFDYSKEMEKSDIRNAIESEVKEYKTIEETVTEEVKTAVEQKVKEVETKKQQIETAKTEIKADEERKATEEQAKEQSQNNDDIKYGTYIGTGGNAGIYNGAKLVIKPNNTYTMYFANGTTQSGGWTFYNLNDIFFDYLGGDGRIFEIKGNDTLIPSEIGGGKFTWESN